MSLDAPNTEGWEPNPTKFRLPNPDLDVHARDFGEASIKSLLNKEAEKVHRGNKWMLGK